MTAGSRQPRRILQARGKDGRPVFFPERLNFLRSGVNRIVAALLHHGQNFNFVYITSVCRQDEPFPLFRRQSASPKAAMEALSGFQSVGNEPREKRGERGERERRERGKTR
jgi:hypothetical protein